MIFSPRKRDRERERERRKKEQKREKETERMNENKEMKREEKTKSKEGLLGKLVFVCLVFSFCCFETFSPKRCQKALKKEG